MHVLKFLCQSQSFLSCKLATSFSTYSTFIYSGKMVNQCEGHAGHIPPQIPFSTINNISMSVNRSDFTLDFFKVGLSFQKKFFIFFNASPSKMMKNAFYFILKFLFDFFVLTFWACRKNN